MFSIDMHTDIYNTRPCVEMHMILGPVLIIPRQLRYGILHKTCQRIFVFDTCQKSWEVSDASYSLGQEILYVGIFTRGN